MSKYQFIFPQTMFDEFEDVHKNTLNKNQKFYRAKLHGKFLHYNSKTAWYSKRQASACLNRNVESLLNYNGYNSYPEHADHILVKYGIARWVPYQGIRKSLAIIDYPDLSIDKFIDIFIKHLLEIGVAEIVEEDLC